MSKPLTCPDGHAMDEGYIECPACGKRREEPMTYDCPSCGLDIDAAGHTADCPPAAEVYRMRGWRLSTSLRRPTVASNKQVVRVNLDVDDAVRRLEIGARRLERAADALRTQREALERLLPEFTDTTTEQAR